jgi:malonyl-CoA decarboxylase
MLQSWFSSGFLELQRITFQHSAGALLEKIARLETVHAVRSLEDLKHRLGYGRCAIT